MSERTPDINHSLSQDLQIIRDTLKLVQRLTPRALPTIVGLAVSEAIFPFITIFFSAQILDELLGARNLQRLFFLVALTLGLNLLLGLARKALAQAQDYQLILIDSRVTQAMAEKTTTMDYVHAENPKIHELRTLAYEGRNWMGGMNNFMRHFGEAMKHSVSIIVSVGFILQLFSLPQIGNLSGLAAFADSPAATWLLLAAMLIAIVISIVVNTKGGKLIYASMKHNLPGNRRFGYLVELFGDYRFGKDIRLYGMRDMFVEELDQFVTHLFRSAMPFFTKNILYTSISLAVSTLTIGFIYLYVVLKALIGSISIGSISLYIGSISQFNAGLSGLVGTLIRIRMFCLFAENYLTYLNLPSSKETGSLAVPEREDGRYEIEFRNVSFRYPGTDKDMLKNISMKLNIGERLAVVGMNGAGKTTFIKLLCRLYDPSEGEILLNGVDIRQIDYREYLELFSVVFQDFKLFAFPIGQNVAASLEVDEEDALRRLEQSGFGERLARMPLGLDTYLYKNFEREGVEVSGGEAQKIGIARALYKDAPFVILDEPTAALDPISEFEIYSTFDSLVSDRTAVYISHRLSSCRFCHDIAVFDDGQIIQRGSHEDLVCDTSGKYYQMWNAQAQYYTDKHEPISAS